MVSFLRLPFLLASGGCLSSLTSAGFSDMSLFATMMTFTVFEVALVRQVVASTAITGTVLLRIVSPSPFFRSRVGAGELVHGRRRCGFIQFPCILICCLCRLRKFQGFCARQIGLREESSLDLLVGNAANDAHIVQCISKFAMFR